jgi:hypothetical protein
MLIPKVLFRSCIIRVFGLSVSMKATMQVMQVNHIFEAHHLTDQWPANNPLETTHGSKYIKLISYSQSQRVCLVRQNFRSDKKVLKKNLAIFASDEKHRKVILAPLSKDYHYCHNGI